MVGFGNGQILWEHGPNIYSHRAIESTPGLERGSVRLPQGPSHPGAEPLDKRVGLWYSRACAPEACKEARACT